MVFITVIIMISVVMIITIIITIIIIVTSSSVVIVTMTIVNLIESQLRPKPSSPRACLWTGSSRQCFVFSVVYVD